MQIRVFRSSTHWLLTAALVSLGLAAGVQLLRWRKQTEIKPDEAYFVTVLSIAVTLLAVAHFGILSPAVTVLTALAYYGGLETSPKVSATILFGVTCNCAPSCSMVGAVPLTTRQLLFAMDHC